MELNYVICWISTKDHPPKEDTVIKIMLEIKQEFFAIKHGNYYYIFNIYSGHWDKKVDAEKEYLYTVIPSDKTYLHPYYAIANARKQEILKEEN